MWGGGGGHAARVTNAGGGVLRSLPLPPTLVLQMLRKQRAIPQDGGG